MPTRKTILNPAADARIIWAFGKPYQFHWITIVDTATGRQVPLGPEDFAGAGNQQKTQIMLHATSSNHGGRAVLDFGRKELDPSKGNHKFAGTHFPVERPPAPSGQCYFGGGAPPIRVSRTGIARLRPDAVM